MSSLRKNVLLRGPKRSFCGVYNDCSPVKWTKYFEKEDTININNDIFHIYSSGNKGPLLLMIHGGGYSALTWSLFSEEILDKIECQILAIDLRGHGNTKTENEENLPLDILANDIVNVFNTIYEVDAPPTILIGHSLGGAIAVAASSLITSVVGVCVIDVVEGTALESLSSMQSILRGRPSSFKSIEQAIQWSFRGGQTHNLEAARVSMPGQIKNLTTGEVAANECDNVNTDQDNKDEIQVPHTSRLVHQRSADAIEEENEEEDKPSDDKSGGDFSNGSLSSDSSGRPPLPPSTIDDRSLFKKPVTLSDTYTWRIDLSKTERFWTGWFRGLSQQFLDIPVPKVLLLANIHGLDTTLTVGQMQGKFQLQVLPKSGHAIHEDQPHHVADIIAGFLVKQKLAVSKHGFTPTMPAC